MLLKNRLQYHKPLGDVEVNGKVVKNVVQIGLHYPTGLLPRARIEITGRRQYLSSEAAEWMNGVHDVVAAKDFDDNSDGNGSYIWIAAPETLKIDRGGSSNEHTADGSFVSKAGMYQSDL